MYYTTGFTTGQVNALCGIIGPADPMPDQRLGRKHKLNLFDRVAITLTYLRGNRTQWELAERYRVDQKTVSNIVRAYTPCFVDRLGGEIPTADDLDPRVQLIIDGTLLPCWSWRDAPQDYSGKHHTTGANVQVATDLEGRLMWVSDPLPGSTHDAQALRQSGLLDAEWQAPPIGDKGYIGLGMITPVRKPPHGELTEADKKFNTALNRIRYKVERAIANLKTWRILFTDYRRPRATRTTTLTAVLALEFYRTSFS
jgi:hypothetical protein